MSEEIDLTYDMDVLQKMASGDTAYRIDGFKFSTPTLEDFYAQDLSPDAAKELQDSLSSTGNQGSMFYVESPYNTEPGYYEDAEVIIVRARPVVPGFGSEDYDIADGEREDKTNAFDGDTLHFAIDSIEGGTQSITVGNSTYTNLKEFIKLNSPVSEMKYGKFGMRFVGVNAPEIPHYTVVPTTGATIMNDVPYSEAKRETSLYIIDKSKNRSDNDKIKFIQLPDKNKWHEVVANDDGTYEYTDKKLQLDIDKAIEDLEALNPTNIEKRKNEIKSVKYYRIVSTDDSEGYENANKGLAAKKALLQLLKDADDFLLMIDHKTLSRKSGSYPDGQTKYDDDFFLDAWNNVLYPWYQVCDMWNAIFGTTGYKYLGFNMYGQDVYKRFLGTLYVKTKVGSTKQWVNAAKYLMSVVDNAYTIIPDYTSDPMKNKNAGFLADAFKIWSYDSDRAKIIDFLSESEFDDRREIQRQLGYNFDEVKDWTVMIGDCLFMVPPTSIRCVTQTTSERVPLLRSRGSMIKSAPKSERLIEMTLYFNDDDGINGKPFEAELPALDANGNHMKTTYYMNGLRTLISMFKLTPFLPVENHYINRVLNIEAVSLVNLQISTMVGYPRCIAATLTLQEFNYHIYMPEIPIPDREDDDAYDINLFAKTINFETLRWHYQRPIQKGESIKNLAFTDSKYIDATFGQRTALQPMKFQDSGIEFYVIDKEYLDQQLQLKLEASTKPLKTQNEITDEMRKWAKQLAYVYDKVDNLDDNTTWKSTIQNLEGTNSDEKLVIYGGLSSTRYKIDINRDHPNNRISTTYLCKAKEDEYGNLQDTVSGPSIIINYLDKVYDALWSTFQGYSDEVWMSEDAEDNSDTGVKTLTWNIDIGTYSSMIPDSTTKENFLKIMAGELYQDDGAMEKFYDKAKDAIKLKVTAEFKQEQQARMGAFFQIKSLKLDKSCPGYKFLQLCSFNYGFDKATDSDFEETNSDTWTDVTSVTMMDELTAEKEAQDYESTATFQFVKYPIGNVNINNMSCVFGNTLTRMSLKALDGFAPQYCGGQDTVIEISMQTMDENTVSQLNLLPRMAAQYVRDYRLILNCWPLRINSEITRLLGVNEVLVEDVDISTVPGQPGLFNITMRLMAVDRTSRNKEALKKIDTPINAGSKTTTTAGTVNTKNFFDLKQTLAKAEIYPDLELPTIDELEYYGFKFVRYLNREGFRVYPDPDFYFVYGHVLGSEIFRNTILSFTSESAAAQSEFQLSDTYSASFNITPEFKNAFAVIEGSENDQALSMNSQRAIIQGIVDKAIAKSKAYDNLTAKEGILDGDIVDIYNSLDAFQTWDVAENISCMFRERKFLDAIDEDDKFYADRITKKSDEAIKLINEELNKPIQKLEDNDITNWNKKDYIQSINDDKDAIPKFVEMVHKAAYDFFKSNKNMAKVMEILDVSLYGTEEIQGYEKVNNGLLETIESIIIAAADAISGDMQYISDDRKDWRARLYLNAGAVTLGKLNKEISSTLASADPNSTDESLLTPFCRIDIAEQGDSGVRFASSLKEAMKDGIAFGPFQIKQFKKSEIEAIENKGVPIDTTLDRLFLDPYYRDLQINHGGDDNEEVKKYKRCIMMDPVIATTAFIRNIMFYLKQLLEDKVLLSLYEVIQSESIEVIGSDDFKVTDRQTATEYYNAVLNTEEYKEKLAEYEALVAEQQKQLEEEQKNWTQEQKDAYEEQQAEVQEAIAKDAAANKVLVEEIKKSLEDSKGPLAIGKLFTAITLAITSKSNNIYTLMQERNYDMLNQIVRGAQLPNSGSEYFMFTKFIYALIGEKVIKSLESIGTKSETATAMLGSLINEKVYIEAADDPAKYVRDSFFDMIVNDKRGRMLRAFPTYYMILIDEGREIGLWKLHDNFYNISSISELQVTKSRKIAADTARIVMTNMFNSYTTDDEDAKDMGQDSEYLQNYQYTWKDVFSSIFSPRTYYMQEELKRLEQLSIEKAQIKPGVRIHLRMGYSADASELPIIFNGVVAEVGTGELVELICQGDGIELTNPILSTSDAEDVQHQDNFVVGRIFQNWLTKGASPRTILGSLLTTRGGWMKKEIYKLTSGRFFNENPYGIVHFGDPQFTDIFQGGECVQNIYEASHKATFGNDLVKDYLTTQYEMDDVPRISSHVFGKSYWDIMHICAGASPDFVTSVVPFGLRSSIFYGMPRYYYAYDYAKEKVGTVKARACEEEITKLQYELSQTSDTITRKITQEKITNLQAKIKAYSADTQSIVIEKRKPFQQFHIYTSYSDIIGNNITVSSKDVRTCAVGLYQRQGTFGKEDMARVGPMWVDFNIYPEKQRTMTVDTQFLAKGVPVLGDVLPFLNKIVDDIGAGKEGNPLYCNGYEIAWRITARALKDSIKDMYQGELIVIGDPSVKPYDKMWIEDVYERMQGCCEVEAVVHNFNVNDGFTTSVFADCISVIDDRHEQITQSLANNIVAKGTAAYIGIATLSYIFASRSRPFLTALTDMLAKGGNLATDAANSLLGILGKDEVINNEKIIAKTDELKSWLGINTSGYKYDLLMKNLKNYEDLLTKIKSGNINSLSGYADAYSEMAKALKQIDPADVIASLKEAEKAASGTKATNIKKAIAELEKTQELITNKILNNPIDLTDYIDDLTDIRNAIDVSKGTALKEAADNLDKIISSKKINTVEGIEEYSKLLKTISTNVDNVDDIFTAGKLAESVVSNVSEAKAILKVSDEVFDAIDTSKDIAKGTKVAFSAAKATLAGTIIGLVIEEAITVVLTGYAYEYVERWMKNLQVLQIFPLKKKGNVLTAGLDGSKGVVVGSPTEKESGLIDTWLGEVFRTGSDKSWLHNAVINILASQEMLETAAKFRRRNNIPEPGTVSTEYEVINLLKDMATDEMNLQNPGYNSGLLTDRVTDVASSEGKELYKLYAVKDSSNLTINHDIKENMIAIQCSSVFSKAIEDGTVKLMHMGGNPSATYPPLMDFELEGKSVKIPSMTFKDSSGSILIDKKTGMPIIDLPFVRPDAHALLREIYDTVKTNYNLKAKATSSGDTQKDHPMIIHSALRAGENKWTCTGLVFRLEIVDYDLKALLDKILEEKPNYFKAVEVSAGVFDILMCPKKITT